jgi:flagellar biosynthesis protein FlhB
MASGGEKTEKPTPKRLKDARKKGQIARSKDLAMAAATVAATFALARIGGRVVSALTERVAGDLSHFGDHPLRDITGPRWPRGSSAARSSSRASSGRSRW